MKESCQSCVSLSGNQCRLRLSDLPKSLLCSSYKNEFEIGEDNIVPPALSEMMVNEYEYSPSQNQESALFDNLQLLYVSHEIYRKRIDAFNSLKSWAEANIPEMECRGDEDCDHCLGLSILKDLK